ncbi:MAG TPA: hypothetical protein VFP72_01240 [Kineosporiaceae bacterium]|nr:hypothetical protein [Kineosporiaceae bacterium]
MSEVPLRVRQAAALGATGLVVAAALAACGGGSGAAKTTAAAVTTPTAASTRTPRAGRFDQAEMQKVRDCLSAAGITMPPPTRTFNPSERPTARPSGAPTGGGGGFGNRGLFADPKVRAALEACGITLPTGRPTGTRGPGGTPAAAPAN